MKSEFRLAYGAARNQMSIDRGEWGRVSAPSAWSAARAAVYTALADAFLVPDFEQASEGWAEGKAQSAADAAIAVLFPPAEPVLAPSERRRLRLWESAQSAAFDPSWVA